MKNITKLLNRVYKLEKGSQTLPVSVQAFVQIPINPLIERQWSIAPYASRNWTWGEVHMFLSWMKACPF